MLAMLKRKFARAARPLETAQVPHGKRVYAIGDIHGRRDLMHQLLAMIEADDAGRSPADTHIIFLGDLVDRGPNSCGVIKDAMALSLRYASNIHFLMGNHEEVFLKACRDNDPKATRFFVRIGGKETILSYSISKAEYEQLDVEQLTERLPDLVPSAHLDFLDSFQDQIVMGDYLFVHAGIKPDTPLPQQKSSDMRWIREEFLEYSGDHEKLVIFGHTIFKDIQERPNYIGIDTGAYESGKLTAICLESDLRWYLQTGNR